ncbi:MAG TPA: ATPase, partial [Chitinophagales bacterium]|nr:ATPase [Chitinophagales bacterium]HNO49158.1 ATPase [Chitinophagales bacterium]
CEMMVNGVNFSDVNTAGKINAGLSIINVLVDYYNVSAPIFIDNKESINNPITCDKSQVVYLTVSNDSKLTIS